MEVDIQSSLDHPNIVKLYEVFQDAKRFYLVMELCTGGELFERIVAESEKHDGARAFEERGAATYMQQILGAMSASSLTPALRGVSPLFSRRF